MISGFFDIIGAHSDDRRDLLVDLIAVPYPIEDNILQSKLQQQRPSLAYSHMIYETLFFYWHHIAQTISNALGCKLAASSKSTLTG